MVGIVGGDPPASREGRGLAAGDGVMLNDFLSHQDGGVVIRGGLAGTESGRGHATPTPSL